MRSPRIMHAWRAASTVLVAAVLLGTRGGQAYGAAPSDPRMAWFDQARFGMFIHWGIYSVPAGEWNGKTDYAEWIQLQARIPGREYAALAKRFDPKRYDAEAWVRLARAAGMKYIVITAKHHDGFCMYDTKLTDYNIVKATPYGRDPLKDLAAACRKAGITLCFYYSVPDWHHPDFPARCSQSGFHGSPNANADLNTYVRYLQGQVRELLTNYGPIGILWFDDGGSFGAVRNRADLIHAQDTIDMIHQLQPGCLVNDRLGLPADYGTPEQRIPGERSAAAFEVCMTTNRHWGYNKNDHQWKSATEVIRNLADIASKGGNYLLNVGPTAEGTLPPEAVATLEEVGRWMGRNGASIYGTGASPVESAPTWGRVTRKGSRLYLHVFDWPTDGNLVLYGLKQPARRAYLLADRGRALRVQSPGAGILRIMVPPTPADLADTVVVVE